MGKKMFAFFGILALALLTLGFTSAAVENVSMITKVDLTNPVTPGNQYNLEVTIVNNNGTNIIVELTNSTSDYGVWKSFDSNITVLDNNTGDIGATLYIPSSYTGTHTRYLTANVYDSSNNLLGEIKKGFTVNYSTTSTPTTNTTTFNTFCDEFTNNQGDKGDLRISQVDIMNNGQGDDEEWQYLDEIVIEVSVENVGSDSIDDVIVELVFKDDDGNTITKKKMGLSDDEEDLGRIKDDNEETVTFTIDEVPIDLASGDYKMYVRAYSEGDEDTECASTSDDLNTNDKYFEFSIEAGEDTTVIVKNDIPNVKTTCGTQNLEVSFMVYNIGDDDEEKVLVTLENSALGIYEKQVIDNLRDGKGKEVTFHVNVPEEVEGTYQKLRIYTYYDYDDDEDEEEESSYDESSEDEGDDFEMYLEIISCASPEPTLQANLNSVAKVGENLVVKAKVSNNGDANDFVFSASGYESWASLVSIDPQTSTIAKNADKEVLITLMPTTSGAQSFKIKTLVDGKTYEQSLSVNIAEKEGFDFGMNNVVFYMIVAIAALVVLILLVLIVKLSRRSRVKVADF